MPSIVKGNEMIKIGKLMEIPKYYIKDILGRLSIRVSSDKKDIFVFANRRGGSTLIMEMIRSQRGVNCVSQPTSLWWYNPYKDLMPNAFLGEYIYLNKEELSQMKSYFDDIVFKRKLRGYSQWNILSRDYKLFWDRLVVKILNAPVLVDWFADNFDVHIINLIRHPIPTSLSIIKENWGCIAEAYLASPWFRDNFLNHEKITFSQDILEKGTKLQKLVLEWCFRNIYFLSVFKERDWLTVTYEELLLRTEQVSDLICKKFDLENPEKMCQRVNKPSRTSTKQSKQDIRSFGSSYLLNRWLEQIDDGVKREIADILNLFDINIYATNDAMPSDEFCLFGSLRAEYS